MMHGHMNVKKKYVFGMLSGMYACISLTKMSALVC